MQRSIAFAVALFDPRGRIDRKGLLVVALVLLSLQVAAGAAALHVGLALEHPVSIALKVLFLWLATAAVAKRLHDIGLSAWKIPKAAVAVVLWSTLVSAALMIALGKAAMAEGQPGFWISLAATTAPVLIATLWLHCAPGMPGANRYGPGTAGNAVETGPADAPVPMAYGSP